MSAKSLLPKTLTPAARRYRLNAAILERVWMERLRQQQLFREGKISFDWASKFVGNDRKLRAKTEELGEVARAIDKLESVDGPVATRKALLHLQEELTQCVAVGIAWLESLEEELK